VALYGVGRLLLPRPSVKNVWLAVLLLIGASRIILPIIWAEGLRAVFLPSLAPKPSATRMTRAFSTGCL
jgi:squalene monooxygenase